MVSVRVIKSIREHCFKLTGKPPSPPTGYTMVGTCVSEDDINKVFGSLDAFESMVEEHGDEFSFDGVDCHMRVTYNQRTHEHYFWKRVTGLSEGKLPIDDLHSLVASHRPAVDATCHMDTSKGFAVLSHLQARRDAPRGSGTAFMKDLCRWADKNGELLVLKTADKGDLKSRIWKTTSSSDRLKTFYGRFGFISNYGKKHYRPDLSGNMHRPPKSAGR